MTGRKALENAAKFTERAKNGVDYSVRYGATCPMCKTPRARVMGSLPWEDNCKIRYHKCINPECPLAILGVSIKSIQIDD